MATIYKGISSSLCLTPGANMTQDITNPSKRNKVYMMRDDVEERHDGQALQHKPHAALPKQQAT